MKYLKHINENLSNLDLINLIEDEFQDITDFNKTIFSEINNHINVRIEYILKRNFKQNDEFFNLEEKIMDEKKLFLNQLKKCINNVDKNLFSFEIIFKVFDENIEKYEIVFKIKK